MSMQKKKKKLCLDYGAWAVICLLISGSKEIREGSRQLVEKLKTYKPSIAAFNGKGKIMSLSLNV